MKVGKWTGITTPFRFRRKPSDQGWHITYGVSGFLVAEGSVWSTPYGMRFFRSLEADFMRRKTVKRPLRKPFRCVKAGNTEAQE